MSDITLENKLNLEFKRYSGWAGGDGVYSFKYHDQLLWYFSDTLISDSDSKTDKRLNFKLINNSFAVSSLDGTNVDFIFDESKKGMVVPPDQGYYWFQDGLVKGEHLYVFALHMTPLRTKEIPFQIGGVDIINIKLPIKKDNIEYQITPLNIENEFLFGAGLIEEDGYYYVYGYNSQKDLVLMRLSNLDQPGPSYLKNDGSWSEDPTDLKILAQHFAPEFKVCKLHDKYSIVYSPGGINSGIYYTEFAKIGDVLEPPVLIYTCPEAKGDVIAYNAKIQPALSQKGKVMISYSVNSLSSKKVLEDLNIYRPRFISWRCKK